MEMECPKRHLFCYVCALFNPSSHRCNISKSVVEGLERYFMATYVPNVWYTPEFVCERCRRFLVLWNKEGKNASIKFRYVLPAQWLPRSKHSPDSCYFCVNSNKLFGHRFETRKTINYATVDTMLPATLRSEQHPLANGELPDASPPINLPDISPLSSTGIVPSLFEPTQIEMGTSGLLKPQLFTQEDFDNLIRDANLSRKSAEVVASRFKQRNLVTSDFRITAARKL